VEILLGGLWQDKGEVLESWRAGEPSPAIGQPKYGNIYIHTAIDKVWKYINPYGYRAPKNETKILTKLFHKKARKPYYLEFHKKRKTIGGNPIPAPFNGNQSMEVYKSIHL
jgi:hypothetical protein